MLGRLGIFASGSRLRLGTCACTLPSLVTQGTANISIRLRNTDNGRRRQSKPSITARSHRRDRLRNEQIIRRDDGQGNIRPSGPPRLIYYVDPEPPPLPKFNSSILGSSWTEPSNRFSQNQIVTRVLSSGCINELQEALDQWQRMRPVLNRVQHDRTTNKNITKGGKTAGSSDRSSISPSKPANGITDQHNLPNNNEEVKEPNQNDNSGEKKTRKRKRRTVLPTPSPSDASTTIEKVYEPVLTESKSYDLSADKVAEKGLDNFTGSSGTERKVIPAPAKKIVSAGQSASTPWWKSLERDAH